jgi:hypothetical protein
VYTLGLYVEGRGFRVKDVKVIDQSSGFGIYGS